jgi:hypothetical protein
VFYTLADWSLLARLLVLESSRSGDPVPVGSGVGAPLLVGGPSVVGVPGPWRGGE